MHYLVLTTITILLWSSLALLVAELSHIPPFLLLATSLIVGGSLSIPKFKQWQIKPTLLLVGVCGIFGYHFLLFMALRLAPPVAAISHLLLEQTPTISTRDMSLMLLLGVGPMGLSFYCWDAAVKKGDPRVIASMSYFTPLLSTLLLITFTDSQFSKQIFLAMLLIVTGAFIANLNINKATGTKKHGI